MITVSRQIGDAFVTISPDSSGFRALADAQIKAAIAGIKAEIPVRLAVDRNALGQFLSAAQKAANIKVNADTDSAAASLGSLKARMESLASLLANLRAKISVDDTAGLATVANLQAKLLALTKFVNKINIGVNADGIVAADAQLLGLAASTKVLQKSLESTTATTRLFTAGVGGWRGALLTGQVALFGGAAAVGVFHLALDVVVETLAIAVPALVTLGAGLLAFGAAAVLSGDSLGKISDHLKAIQTVSQATGQQISPLINRFDSLQHVIRPQVWQLYGDAINLSGKQFGLVSRLAESTGAVLDRFAARIVVAFTQGSGGMNTFIAAGTRDLQQLGRIAVSLGDVILKLIEVSTRTHIADFLLAGIVAASKFLDLLSKLPIPLLALAIGLHGVYLWGGLAATVLLKVLSPLAGLIASAGGVSRTASAVAGLGDSASRLDRLKAGFKDLGHVVTDSAAGIVAMPGRITSVGTAAEESAGKTSLLSRAMGFISGNAWTLGITAGVVAFAALVFYISKVKDATDKWISSIKQTVAASTIFTAINVTAKALVDTNTKLATSTGKISENYIKFSPALQQSVRDTKNVRTEHDLLSQQLDTEVTHLSQVAHAYGTTLPGAMALASFAGVRVSDLMSKNNTVWATAMAQIAGVVTGYKNMGQGLGQLGSDINVVTVQASDQLKAIANLNNAYDGFIKNVGAPIDTFISFANSLIKFGNDAGVAGAQMTGLGSGVQNMSRKVTDASLQLQSDFQSSFTAANQLFDAMRTSEAPAAQQIKAIKDTVASLIPLAGTSKVAAAEISALAQEAGGPATTNLQTLQKWAGVTGKQGMTGLQKDTNNAAIAMSNLSLDAQKLSNTLQTDLTAEMSKAIENAVGLQGAMDKYTKSLHDNGAAAASTKSDRKQLFNDLMSIFHNADQANAIIKTLSGAFTDNGAAAATAHADRDQVVKDFNNQWHAAVSARTDLNTYTNAVLNNGVNSNVAKAARQQLIKDIVNAGVNSRIANADVANYSTAISRNGATSDQAKAARQQLIKDILNASNNAKQGKTDTDRLTTAIQQHGTTSNQYKSARQQLITDLINAGVQAKTAASLVDGLTNSIGKVPKNPNVTMIMTGKGSYTISAGPRAIPNGPSQLAPLAGGGVLSGYAPGRDSVHAVLSPGEGVLVPEAVRAIGPGTVMALNKMYSGGRQPGGGHHFAGGGLVTHNMVSGSNPNILPVKMYADFGGKMVKDLSSQMSSAMNAAVAAALASMSGTGTGSDIVSYAQSFLGKIPYVWGGTSLSSRGADCSGFTGSVYRHFGYNGIPRTSEAQGAWVSTTKTPQSGGLAFYHSPAGGPDPGHVAIVRDGNSVISQGGGLGPKIMALHGMPLLWTGVPPGGFHQATSAAGLSGGGGPAQQIAQRMLNQRGWGVQWPAFNSLVNAESGWRVNATNPSSGAYGIPQALPGSKMASAGADWRTNAATQLSWMMSYIAGRYGDPNGAWAHELGSHWYSGGGVVADRGATLKPGWNPPMYNATGHNEPLIPSGGALTAGERAIISALHENTHAVRQQAAAFSQALNGAAGRAANVGYYS